MNQSQQRHLTHFNHYIQGLNQLKKDLEKISNHFSNEIVETKQLISESLVSNVWLDLFGVSIIFTGPIYGTIPDLIENVIF